MKPDLKYFKTEDFHTALQIFFENLNIPVNYLSEEPVHPRDILEETYKKAHDAFELMDDVYFLGMVDDAAFEGAKSLSSGKIESDYDGILIFGVTLHSRKNGLLPARSQLAEISRSFNREFHYTPVIVIFRYDNFIAFANTERLTYKQKWREGEKTGKVSLLRDIEIAKPHTGHLKILEDLKITRSGKKGINSFKALYHYWQEVFSVSHLNKKFYTELSNWYFWAVKHVIFPGASSETDSEDLFQEDSKVREHNAKNIIHLLTRLLFVWFIKEKKLIPEELFELKALQKNILKKITPFHEKHTLFEEANRNDSKAGIYYKTVLQNLFFATLNCPIKADSTDTRARGFRGSKSYVKHRGVDWMMRYKKHFKNPDAFLSMVNKIVPFLNGGLFECLDDKENKIYTDGFSDNMSKTDGVENRLVMPDYLFFGTEETTDLSADYGTGDKSAKQASVKGLINILNSYKFTIAENTPIEEDVALDPELLGKVFENLLASYNLETKTTARKQTGSFYTPREIVNYMVDESLIAHFKNSVSAWDMEEDDLDENLHRLVSYDYPANPFGNDNSLSKEIVHSLDNCKILDPACGSGHSPWECSRKWCISSRKLTLKMSIGRICSLKRQKRRLRGLLPSWTKNREKIACLK